MENNYLQQVLNWCEFFIWKKMRKNRKFDRGSISTFGGEGEWGKIFECPIRVEGRDHILRTSKHKTRSIEKHGWDMYQQLIKQRRK